VEILRRFILEILGLQEPGETEVKDLHPALGGDHDVVGFQVAVDDAVAVGVGERLGDRDRGADPFPDRHRPAADAVPQGLPLDQLHDQELDPVLLADLVDDGDAGVVQGRRRLRLAAEPQDPFARPGPFRRQYLDRDVPVQLGVEGLPGQPHASLADNLDEAVLGQHSTRLDAHDRSLLLVWKEDSLTFKRRILPHRGVQDRSGAPTVAGFRRAPDMCYGNHIGVNRDRS
jgi:hypothetical protein